jgi:unconventional prefoldin RPB5 interactor 1
MSTAEVPSTMDGLEVLRKNLEAQISNLQRTLRYWQTWEAEYEGLREELEAEDDHVSPERMVAIGADFGGDVVNEKEMKELVYFDKPRRRSKAEVLSTITARMETGRRNAETMQKQIEKAEVKLAKVMIISNPSVQNEDGDPLMEIQEELDEEGNVISSNVSNYDKTIGQMQQVLNKAVLAPKTQSSSLEPAAQSSESESKSQPSGASNASAIDMATRPAGDPSPTDEASRASAAFGKLSEGNRIVDIDDLDPSTIEVVHSAFNDADTAEGAAAARREIYKNLQDLNPIAATMDFDEEGGWSDEDDDVSDDDENEYGMGNIHNELDDDYFRQMQELMEKHSSSFTNLGPKPDMAPMAAEASVSSKNASTPAKSSISSKPTDRSVEKPKKGVRFAEDLDISPAPEIPKESQPTKSTLAPSKRVIADSIVERSPSKPPKDTGKPTRVSRFKAARTSQDGLSTAETTPVNSTTDAITNTMSETSGSVSFGDELAAYRQRMDRPEAEIDRSQFRESPSDPMEGIEELPYRVSKFKAARMGITIEDPE